MPKPADHDDGANGGARAPKKKSNTGMILAIVGGVLALSCCVCGGGGAAGFYFLVYKPGQEPGKIVAKAAAADGKAAVAGATILEKKETLTDKDPAKANGKPAKEYKVRLEQGKRYVIDLKADKKFDPKKIDPKKIDLKNLPHDPYLRLLDPTGKEVAANDDIEFGKNLDSQIRYTPITSGEYTIQATVLDIVPPGGMPFSLTVKLE